MTIPTTALAASVPSTTAATRVTREAGAVDMAPGAHSPEYQAPYLPAPSSSCSHQATPVQVTASRRTPPSLAAHLTLALLLVIISTSCRLVSALPVVSMNQWSTLGCIWRSSISPTMPREQVFSPRPECQFGQLWWYDAHPGYILRVYFRHQTSGTDFRLCLQHNEKGYISKIHRQNGTIDTLLKPPEEGVETCIQSEKGSLELYFEAPSFDVYVTVIEYVMRDAEPP